MIVFIDESGLPRSRIACGPGRPRERPRCSCIASIGRTSAPSPDYLEQLLLPALCWQHQEPAAHRVPRSSAAPSARQTAHPLGRRRHPSLHHRPRISRIVGRQNHRLPPASLRARTQPRGVSRAGRRTACAASAANEIASSSRSGSKLSFGLDVTVLRSASIE